MLGTDFRRATREAPAALMQKFPTTLDRNSGGQRHKTASLVARSFNAAPAIPSLQIHDLQGDFDEMQGDDKRRSAESCQLSIAWMKLSLLGEQGAVLV